MIVVYCDALVLLFQLRSDEISGLNYFHICTEKEEKWLLSVATRGHEAVADCLNLVAKGILKFPTMSCFLHWDCNVVAVIM